MRLTVDFEIYGNRINPMMTGARGTELESIAANHIDVSSFSETLQIASA